MLSLKLYLINNVKDIDFFLAWKILNSDKFSIASDSRQGRTQDLGEGGGGKNYLGTKKIQNKEQKIAAHAKIFFWL